MQQFSCSVSCRLCDTQTIGWPYLTEEHNRSEVQPASTDMETAGIIAPSSPADARRMYAELDQPAEVVVKEVSRVMAIDPEEYERRVSEDAIETARDALFASLLSINVGTREEYEQWREEFDGAIHEIGSEHVEQVVWHAFDGEAVAATFQAEQDAAIATLRRQAFGELYREVLADASATTP